MQFKTILIFCVVFGVASSSNVFAEQTAWDWGTDVNSFTGDVVKGENFFTINSPRFKNGLPISSANADFMCWNYIDSYNNKNKTRLVSDDFDAVFKKPNGGVVTIDTGLITKFFGSENHKVDTCDSCGKKTMIKQLTCRFKEKV